MRYDKLGSCEIGRDQVTEVDDKYLDDGRIKFLKTLRDILACLAKKNPSQVNSFATIGYFMVVYSEEE
ncbi:unnamed protein product [Rhizopus microsporus]|nr:hypothetical protein RMCBS344292_17984 [Rhizopus microsporus]